MICADTSCWIAFLAGESGDDLDVLDGSLARKSVAMAPVVLAELLSSPELPTDLERLLTRLPLLPADSDYWWRSGKLRAKLRKHGVKPKLADTLIAQTCLDHGVPLLTRDRGFQRFARYAGLKLL